MHLELDGGRRAAAAVQRLVELDVHFSVTLDRAEDGIARDRVEPRLELAHLAAALERGPGAHERLLDDVVRVSAQQAARVPVERRAVAVHDGLEGLVAAGLGELDEPRVGLGAKQQRVGAWRHVPWCWAALSPLEKGLNSRPPSSGILSALLDYHESAPGERSRVTFSGGSRGSLRSASPQPPSIWRVSQGATRITEEPFT
jgi:hypothetical protein